MSPSDSKVGEKVLELHHKDSPEVVPGCQKGISLKAQDSALTELWPRMRTILVAPGSSVEAGLRDDNVAETLEKELLAY